MVGSCPATDPQSSCSLTKTSCKGRHARADCKNENPGGSRCNPQRKRCYKCDTSDFHCNLEGLLQVSLLLLSVFHACPDSNCCAGFHAIVAQAALLPGSQGSCRIHPSWMWLVVALERMDVRLVRADSSGSLRASGPCRSCCGEKRCWLSHVAACSATGCHSSSVMTEGERERERERSRTIVSSVWELAPGN